MINPGLYSKHRIFFRSLAAATAYFLLEPLFHRFYYDFTPDSFLVLHSIMESVSIIIAFMSFGITFHSRKLTHNNQNLFLGVSFLCIGIIDVFHALSYIGMPAFITANTVNKATQLWILARLTGAAAFLAAAFIRPASSSRLMRPFPLLAAGLAIPSAVLVTVVLYPDMLPAMYVPGKGLTTMKVGLEYAVVAAQAAAAVLFYRMYKKTHEEHLVYFIGAMAMGIFSELFFTLYASPYDIYNLMGHVYKVAGYFFVYFMLFATSIEKPYGELDNAREVMKEYSENLEKMVEERTEALAEKNDDLLRLNKLKDEFLAMCSHDMRTPLQSSILLLEILMEETDGSLNDDQKQSLEAIKSNEFDQLELINNLLELARQQSGELSLDLSKVDVADMLSLWAERQRFLADKKKISFRVDQLNGSGTLSWQLDKFKITQVLNNLASNAFRYTTERGEVRVTVNAAGPEGWLSISVFNTGKAIPASELKTIFGKYARASGENKVNRSGLGIGLNIAKTNVELHGGSIWAESEEGLGNTFTFTIPPVSQGSNSGSGRYIKTEADI